MSQGRRIGVFSALGIAAGSVVHTFAAALGLSAILGTSSAAFAALKMVGAAYLVYLGVRLLVSSSAEQPTPNVDDSGDTQAAIC